MVRGSLTAAGFWGRILAIRRGLNDGRPAALLVACMSQAGIAFGNSNLGATRYRALVVSARLVSAILDLSIALRKCALHSE